MMLSPLPEVTRMHQLAWQPGAWMAEPWWEQLGLAAWREQYARMSSVRKALDELIIKRRGFPASALPAQVPDDARYLLSLEPRLPVLLTGMGLVLLGGKPYLMMGEYRRALTRILGGGGCDQLLMLWPRGAGASMVELAADDLPAHALAVGAGWLQRLDLGPAGQALAVLLPPAMDAPPDAFDLPMSFFIRMARFL
ncbi:hypothetical protein FNU76_01170 [Chitinimonas arctica]|uniref:Uncharacterized protein n=1 Tax=Chitinimonas arctica TaxID=2594795 RepID=A0A516SA92_9NEIS|nr:type III secretion system domain-containing protein [Chitinimonas arctica]QDQ25071.1 hypothetical protein FNU76_01170 [Chitinimonas arctica]